MCRIAPMVAVIAVMIAGYGSSARASADAKIADPHREAPAIAHAVRGTLADYIRGDAQAFCADFTPEVAAHLVRGHANCQAGVAPAFVPKPGQETIYLPSERPNGLKVSHIRW